MGTLPPVFSMDLYVASVNETGDDHPLPVEGFLSVECSTDNLTYAITTPENAGPFDIDPLTGSLFATASIDYETAPSYQFEVSCSNTNNPSLNDTATVEITVEPVNERRPSVVPSSVVVLIDELTPPGTALVSSLTGVAMRSFRVTDTDTGPDEMITFSLTVDQRVSEDYFNLNSTTGTLYLNRTLDIDEDIRLPIPVSISLQITACDLNPPVADCPNVRVTVFVNGVNDNPPMFSQDTYVVSEPESVPVGVVIASVSCTDIDRSVGVLDSYNVSSVLPVQVPLDTFSIDALNGNITLSQPLDYEFVDEYVITVSCSDTEGLQDNATVVVMVTDVNDNAPNVTTSFDDVIDVNDNLPVNSEIFQFQCTDEDSNENGNVVYSIESDINGLASSFAINNMSGNVSVASSLVLPDEVFTMFVTLAIECSDQGDPPLSENSIVVVRIYKDDSTPPVINNTSISDGFVSISESAPVDFELLIVIATDTTSPGLVYSLRNESSPGTFVINSTSGSIALAQSLDRESIDSYSFVVVVTEERVAPGEPERDEAEVVVEVLDINDNPPMFSQEVYTVTHAEDLPVGETVLTVMCRDFDIMNDDEFVYEITDSSLNDTFVINATSGSITLVSPLDYELSSVYTIDVVCFDVDRLEGKASVVVMVTDVNDNVPVITTFYDDVIPVNDQSQVNLNIIQFNCTDEDSNENSDIVYSIDFEDYFTIDNVTGYVRVSSSLTLQSDVFSMAVNITTTCSDQGDPQLMSSLIIGFLIYKDDSTPPVFNRGNFSTEIPISEDAPIGYDIVQVSATDTTSPSLLFSIINESTPGVFAIDAMSGEITLAQELDRETIDAYTFAVVVTEVRVIPGDEQSDDVEFMVVVVDINDNPPVFSEDVYNILRPENFTVNETIAIVSCTDADSGINGSFSGYEILAISPNSSEASDMFAIDSSTGNIILERALDYEGIQSYSIDVVCYDNGGMMDMAVVEINVVDVNDNDPRVTKFFNDVIIIRDNLEVGTIIDRFNCTDSDSNENGNVTYSIADTLSLFSVDPITGYIVVMSPLTLDSGVFLVDHNITVRCNDQGNPQRSNATMISFQLYKYDSGPPVINMESISFGEVSISEAAEVGDTLVQVIATDTTSPGLTFSLESETSPGTFIINPSTGLITLAGPLDRERISLYSFRVVVTEVLIGPFSNAGRARRVRMKVNVTVEDENDNYPICNDGNDIVKYISVGNYSFNNSLELAKLLCTDMDVGMNGDVIFDNLQIPDVKDGSFTFNETSKTVRFTGILSKNDSYSIIVQASDRGIPPLSTTVNVTVVVSGEKSTEFTTLERMLLIIVPSVSGGLFLCACFIILCMCCCCCRRKKKKEQDTYDLR